MTGRFPCKNWNIHGSKPRFAAFELSFKQIGLRSSIINNSNTDVEAL